MTRVGLISDTHGLLRPQALAFLSGCDLIVHAGDVCDGEVLARLAEIAPLTVVRGNNDRGPWADSLRTIERVTVGEVSIVVVHDLADIARLAADVRVVVSGHSHKPSVQTRDGVLYVNPGSAGPRRFSLPITAAELRIDGASVTAQVVDLVALVA